LRLLHYFNPGVPIYGLYGGRHEDWNTAKQSVGGALVHLYMWSAVDQYWKWLHGDLAVKEWFRAYGNTVPFDLLYEYEFDMLVCAPLCTLYPSLPKKGVAFSAVTPIESVASRWQWIVDERSNGGYLEFRNYLRERYGLDSIKQIVLGPGPLLTWSFLSAFCELEDCDLAHNEITYPAFAQLLGFALVDNRLHPGLWTQDSERWFRCHGESIEWKEVEPELRWGIRRAFHPVKYHVTLEQVINALY
jgi:hypothetical protein